MLHAEGVLSGSVYFDMDGDGMRDADEIGVPGVVIRLSDSSDPSMDRSMITDDNGIYTFGELEPGTYQISKRQSRATTDGAATSAPGAVSGDDLLSDVVLADDQNVGGNNFAEQGLQLEFITYVWFTSRPAPVQQLLRETLARSEEQAGDSDLAASIRAGGSNVPDGTNNAPIATDDAFSVEENEVLNVAAASGVLANDSDSDGDLFSATLVGQASNGVASLSDDGSFTYTPNANFSGADAFTYQVSDSIAISNLATVRINVNPVNDGGNQPFAPVVTGAFDDPNLLGIRTDTQPGAPPITAEHVSTAVDYGGFSNPPTYGPHHGFLADAQNSITPRPTGIYTTEQPDEDLVHNLEHGHVWISYNPNLLSNADQNALVQLVEDGGTDTGVILTPRSGNTSAIALASWAHLLTLNSFDATQVRDFVETNRGHSPEGFIPSGQKGTSNASESLDDGLLHTQTPNQPFGPVTTGSIDDLDLLGIRMDTQPGAPPFTLEHTQTAVDYSAFDNAPSYGAHHPFISGFTPRPTGVYETEQPDEDLVHNLEHGHVWISYNPSLISSSDLNALEQLVIDGGTDTGVIVTPRSRNTSPIVVTSLTRQLTLDSFNAKTIRDFVNTNRGHSPEGFIPSGQKGATSASENLDDGLLHALSSTESLAPVATDDVFTVDENGVLTIAAASGVLANDTDSDGDALAAILVGQASNGEATLNADGSFTYTPDIDFSGIDSFTYQASDGTTTSSVATVTVTVTPVTVNTAPSAVDDAYSVKLGDVLTVASTSGVLANDSDADADPLTAQLVDQPDNGTLALNADGSFTYSPATGFTGIDSFSYMARDGVMNSGVATVSVQVAESEQAVPNFTLVDVNPLSPSEGEGISPRDYLQQVSGWYFGHST